MYQDPFVAKRVAARERRRERRKTLILWVSFLLLVGVHVLIYVYSSEIMEFIEGGRDAVVERIGENNE